jgi:hypothetical protein
MLIYIKNNMPVLVDCFKFYQFGLRSEDFYKSIDEYIEKLTGMQANEKQRNIVLKQIEFKKVIALEGF